MQFMTGRRQIVYVLGKKDETTYFCQQMHQHTPMRFVPDSTPDTFARFGMKSGQVIDFPDFAHVNVFRVSQQRQLEMTALRQCPQGFITNGSVIEALAQYKQTWETTIAARALPAGAQHSRENVQAANQNQLGALHFRVLLNECEAWLHDLWKLIKEERVVVSILYLKHDAQAGQAHLAPQMASSSPPEERLTLNLMFQMQSLLPELFVHELRGNLNDPQFLQQCHRLLMQDTWSQPLRLPPLLRPCPLQQ
jgi:hypothetical protein